MEQYIAKFVPENLLSPPRIVRIEAEDVSEAWSRATAIDSVVSWAERLETVDRELDLYVGIDINTIANLY